MEPINTGTNNPNFSPEVNSNPLTPEQFNPVQERQEILRPRVERAPVQNQTTAAQVTQFDPVVQDDASNSKQEVQITPGQNDVPQTATDADRIDQEWVNKVKEVISRTSNDPSAQQREVSNLMAEYILKRFGRRIGEAD